METSKTYNTDTPEDLVLDRLYAAWKDDHTNDAPGTLREWTAQYPAYKAELTQWMAVAPVLQCEDDRTGPEIERAEARALETGRQILAARRARYTVAAPAFADIYSAARNRSMSPRALATTLGVGLPIIAKLQQRLIQFGSIPAAFIDRLATELQVGVQQISDYLQQPASLAAGASYKSKGVPQAAPQEDFATAIRTCPDMSAAQRAVWLEDGTNE
jgi:hypothetical protein